MQEGLFFCQISIPLAQQGGMFKVLSTTGQKETKDLTTAVFPVWHHKNLWILVFMNTFVTYFSVCNTTKLIPYS